MKQELGCHLNQWRYQYPLSLCAVISTWSSIQLLVSCNVMTSEYQAQLLPKNSQYETEATGLRRMNYVWQDNTFSMQFETREAMGKLFVNNVCCFCLTRCTLWLTQDRCSMTENWQIDAEGNNTNFNVGDSSADKIRWEKICDFLLVSGLICGLTRIHLSTEYEQMSEDIWKLVGHFLT